MARICRIICGYLKRNRWGDLKCSIKGAFVLRIPEFRQNRAALSADWGVWDLFPFPGRKSPGPAQEKPKQLTKGCWFISCIVKHHSLISFFFFLIIPWICCRSDFLGAWYPAEPSSFSLGIEEKIFILKKIWCAETSQSPWATSCLMNP